MAQCTAHESEQDLVASATVDMVCVFVFLCFFFLSREVNIIFETETRLSEIVR